jgi:ribonucleoside-diphosphate reductase alpha chain
LAGKEMEAGSGMAASGNIAFSEGALAVLSERYFRRDAQGRCIEDPLTMFSRVANAIAEISADFGEDRSLWADRFFSRMQRLEFLPNSPTLMNAGTSDGQLAACFVLPVEDDLDSIFSALNLAARIHQTGGGTGFSFSKLRPRGDQVTSTGGISSGPVSFIELFDHTTALIRQGGRRRGANMGVLRIDHPDIREFIDAKLSLSRLENFNLSVGVTDEFLAALASGTAFPLRNPRTGRVVCDADPQELFDRIVHSAWATGDPGLLFLDEINRRNPTPALGPIEATNPCGEQPLLPYESCTLGSLNLRAFASSDGGLDWSRLQQAVRDAVVFLDNVVQANKYLTHQIATATYRTRKIGLGVMGFADLLALSGLAYDSEPAIALGGRIASFITTSSREVSAELGAKRGSFPAFNSSVLANRGYASMRNATVTCVAPTGTLSIIAGVAGGIEPFFSLATRRRVLDHREFIEVNRLASDQLGKLGSAGEKALQIVRDTGSLREAQGIPEVLRRRFLTALEVAPSSHIRMQAAFQEHVDAAVSKTVNLPAEASPEAVRDIFLLAAKSRLKGVTVYRYGSRPRQVLSRVGDFEDPDCRECAV